MILTPDILNSLNALFEDVWIAGGGEEINVTCPYCASRMGSGDSSGHLGLNFSKDMGHCVRCDWGTRGVRKWLKKFGFAAVLPAASARQSLSMLRTKLERPQAPYRLGQISLPPVRKIASTNYRDQDAFAESLLAKGVSLEEARRNTVCYCDSGRYDGYVVFPFIEDGQIVYWQARGAYPKLLEDSKLKKRNPTDKEATFGKSYWLYGYDFAHIGGTLVITEGTLDQITTQTWLEETGRADDGWYAISLQGTAISGPDPERHPLNSQLGKMHVLDPTEIVVLLDAEAWVKAEGLAEYLYACGFNARAAKLPKGDPNEAHAHPDFFKSALATTGLDALRSRLANAKTL